MAINISKSDEGRGGYCLTSELLVAEPREHVFKFFADAFQLETITPPWLHFAVETPRPIEMKPGTLIDYRLRLHGLPVRWRSKISVWEPPFQFVDEQVHGPYRFWEHLHTFEETDTGTSIRDMIDYAVPLSFFAHPWVRRDLLRIFNYRLKVMRELFTAVD